jgi:hypothetical protein
VAALAVCLAMFATIAAAERHTSPTTDEAGHLVRGLAFWWAPDTRLSWPHPPVGQALAAAPVALTEPAIDFTAQRGWDEASFIAPTRTFFRRYFPLARGYLRTARLCMAALAALLALYLFEWTRRRYDSLTAWLALFAYAANPVILAHAGLMTTDFPVTAATFLLVTQLHDYLRLGRGHLLGVIVAAALLATTKLSGLLVLALMAPFAVGAAFFGVGRFARIGSRRFSQPTVDLLAVVAAVVLAINAAYRFDEVGLTVQQVFDHPRPSSWLGSRVLSAESPLARLPPGLRLPFPWTYLHSLDFTWTHARLGQPVHWFGRMHDTGQPGYFVVLLGIKLPSAMLAMLAAGVGSGVALAVARRQPKLATVMLGHLCLAFAIVTYDARINLGLRHALVVVPALAVLAARGVTAWSREPIWMTGAQPHPLAAAGGLAIGALVAGAWAAHPRYIADFNAIVGGREGGHRISLAAEDWGQDVGELGRLAVERGWAPLVYYTHHGLRNAELRQLRVRPRGYLCNAPFPADHWVAIHRWRVALMPDAPCVVALEGRPLVQTIHDHILVYGPKVR